MAGRKNWYGGKSPAKRSTATPKYHTTTLQPCYNMVEWLSMVSTNYIPRGRIDI